MELREVLDGAIELGKIWGMTLLMLGALLTLPLWIVPYMVYLVIERKVFRIG